MEKKKVIASLSVWSFVHFALFMFNGGFSSPIRKREAFYPFTNVYPIERYFDLHYYDITELLVYVGGAWLAFFLYYYLKDDNKA